MAEIIGIGEWEFSPEAAFLSRGEDHIRLENRAAAVLEVLCRRKGDLVSHSELVDAVWHGRALSPNSIAVVIADIRRALEDDARAPIYIETIPKRGYRIAAQLTFSREPAPLPQVTRAIESAAPTARGLTRRWLPLATIFAVLFASAALVGQARVSPSSGPDYPTIGVGAFDNETGDDAYAPLSSSISELAATELMRIEGVRITNQSSAKTLVRGTIILWDGHVAVALHAENVPTGEVIWSGMASGPETKLPMQVRQQFVTLAETLQE